MGHSWFHLLFGPSLSLSFSLSHFLGGGASHTKWAAYEEGPKEIFLSSFLFPFLFRTPAIISHRGIPPKWPSPQTPLLPKAKKLNFLFFIFRGAGKRRISPTYLLLLLTSHKHFFRRRKHGSCCSPLPSAFPPFITPNPTHLLLTFLSFHLRPRFGAQFLITLEVRNCGKITFRFICCLEIHSKIQYRLQTTPQIL